MHEVVHSLQLNNNVRRHDAMSANRRTRAVGIFISVLLMATFLTGCLRPVRSRVLIPGSTMKVVVTEDIAGTYSCQLFDRGHTISDFHMLGPAASERCSVVSVDSFSNIVTIRWADGGNQYAASVDVDARRFVTNGLTR